MRSEITILIAIGTITLSACVNEDAPARTECDTDYAELKSEEMAIIDQGMTVYSTVSEDEWTTEQQALMEQTSTLLESRSRHVDEKDLEIIDRAKEILKDEAVWDREDDRQCEAGDTKFSLYCALFFASEEIIGEYQHRRTALQEVRFALQDATEGRDYDHRLRDFNNDPMTTLNDVYSVLATARAQIKERLRQQEACEL